MEAYGHIPVWTGKRVERTTWVKRYEVDTGMREGVTTADAQRMKELERIPL